MTYQLKQTRYSDPDATSGQHTNGPANIFVRENESSPWYVVTGTKSLSKVQLLLKYLEFGKFVEKYCEKVKA